MPKYVIERDLPGAGALSPAELHTIAVKSNQVVANMGPRIQWVHSYVTDDKLYCVYIAEDEQAIYDHGRCGGFPSRRSARSAACSTPPPASDTTSPIPFLRHQSTYAVVW